MADATKIQLGICSVVYKGVDLGHTKNGVTVTYTPDFHKTEVDLYGSTPVEFFLVGESLKAKVNLAEYTIANLLVAINQGVAAGDDAVSIGSKAGKRASTTAGLLVLHPVNSPANDTRQYDVAMYKAIVTSELPLDHKNDSEKMIPVEFESIVDEGRTDGNMLGFIGDSIS
jgi:hypothetical protein